MNLDRKIFTTNVGGEELKIEVSKIASQTNAAAIGTYGGTAVLVTAVMDRKDREVDYMPLSVDYEEKFYAGGKILGSRYVRREGRAPESSILSGRLIDRIIRPLFDSRIRRGIQVVSTVLSYDDENDPDFVSVVTASVVLAISNIPWNGPVAGLRIAKLKGDAKIYMNPKNSFIKENHDKLEFDTFVAGPKGRISMVELSGYEAEKKNIVSAYREAIAEFDKIVTFQEGIIGSIGKPKDVFEFRKPAEKLVSAVKEFLGGRIEGAVFSADKSAYRQLGDELAAHLKANEFIAQDVKDAQAIYGEELDKLLHREVLTKERRPDGRKLGEVRELHAEVALLPRTHGSALFIRGQTQALAVTTLASPGSEQVVETIEFSGKKKFMLHYNFPAFSVGETGPFRGPARRDIGHGALAEKAILPLVPKSDVFPYTVRVVSEILSSNGSSSMATVCATSLSLMDAGVPLKSPAAGIAMGLIVDEETLMSDSPTYKVLTDIQGLEDHYGDMDFKVAGTKDGVTAIQMDVKLYGVTVEILEAAFADAEKARLHILDFTNKTLSAPRPELSRYAPRILTIAIDPTRIGEVIGTGGKIINGIIEMTGATSIDIEEDGRVFVTAMKVEQAEAAVAQINAILKEYQIGEIIEGKVVKLLDFGAIVEFGGHDGMIHVSELREGFVKKVDDVVKLGDVVKAKIVKIDNGKIGLSLKQLPKA
ncbi:MAG: polyribonucleotide nucleotidyltransferase [Candidatus Colwellbacteria bacterium RIFCSPLOWO2_01_FULL_48_10]|uniref:Polyribonucleotide nucleotidyltransferase n=1 Tax=Candidatus Colwellbacteria bacterium RIFCSPLOWO2_01_FULL_48_10 TaxID=1797690 RepID=A0A1G1Z6X9_9BACT|nr:MAG: polyribonucleotide nucleotidyltransferase [Candidatus Colwellbacteria bacterium RIFCSPLOWO2_01_FULL_48_10]